jgi:hypothetical protein
VFSVDVQIRRWPFGGRLTPETAQRRDAGELVELLPAGGADAALMFAIAYQQPHPTGGDRRLIPRRMRPGRGSRPGPSVPA